MASVSRRIRRNMARPADKQRKRNRRAVAGVMQPLAAGMARIGKELRLSNGTGAVEDSASQ